MRISSITKNAGKACNNRLYRHIRTFEKIVKNYFVIYIKRSKKIVSLKKNEVYAVSKKTVYALLLETQNGDFICEIDKANKALQVINEWKKGDR